MGCFSSRSFAALPAKRGPRHCKAPAHLRSQLPGPKTSSPVTRRRHKPSTRLSCTGIPLDCAYEQDGDTTIPSSYEPQLESDAGGPLKPEHFRHLFRGSSCLTTVFLSGPCSWLQADSQLSCWPSNTSSHSERSQGPCCLETMTRRTR